MKESLKPGIEHEFRYRVPESKTVPVLYPESPEFQEMPRVFATGFLVGLVEWACIRAVNPHLDWPREMTVGTHVNLSHEAATPAGMEVRVQVRLTEVDGRKLTFAVEADDGVQVISHGTHQRFVIDAERFNERMRHKAASAR
jgi:fluoroacetyl-CoA thioesterase